MGALESMRKWEEDRDKILEKVDELYEEKRAARSDSFPCVEEVALALELPTTRVYEIVEDDENNFVLNVAIKIGGGYFEFQSKGECQIELTSWY